MADTVYASERHIEKRVGEYVKAKHGQWIKLTGTKGIPDRMILLPQGKVWFIEMKRPGNNEGDVRVLAKTGRTVNFRTQAHSQLSHAQSTFREQT